MGERIDKQLISQLAEQLHTDEAMAYNILLQSSIVGTVGKQELRNEGMWGARELTQDVETED